LLRAIGLIPSNAIIGAVPQVEYIILNQASRFLIRPDFVPQPAIVQFKDANAIRVKGD
jgi:hypothetical protein